MYDIAGTAGTPTAGGTGSVHPGFFLLAAWRGRVAGTGRRWRAIRAADIGVAAAAACTAAAAAAAATSSTEIPRRQVAGAAPRAWYPPGGTAVISTSPPSLLITYQGGLPTEPAPTPRASKRA